MNWGIIATGRIARKFAQTINQMKGEGHKLVAVASRKLSGAETFAKEFSIPHYYASYEELAKDSDVQVVYIATLNNLHFENVMMCLNYNKHVLCEKPLTLSKKNSELMYEKAEEKGLFLMEGFWISLIPALRQIKKIIADGVIGKLQFVRVDYGFSLSPERRYRKFASELGGGALWDIGIYTLGFLRYLLGENPESYTASVHKNEFATDDYSSIIFKYKNGTIAAAITSIGIDLGKKALIQGSLGLILLDDFQQAQSFRIIKYDGTCKNIELPFDINGFEYEIREVENCIQKKISSSLIHTASASTDTISLIEKILKENQ